MRNERREKKKEGRREEREERVQNRPRGALEAGCCSLLSQLHSQTLSLTHKQPEGERDPEIMKLVLFVEYFLLLGYEAIV